MGKGFLERAVNEEDTDQEGSDLEEMYERLFPKIGRDFVYKDDLLRVMGQIMRLLDPLGLSPIDGGSDGEARRKALEYKRVLDSGRDGSKIYKDLINLDDD